MKYFIAILSLFLFTRIKAQKSTPVVVNSGGSTLVANDIHYEFSLGETFTLTIGNPDIVTQGLLQSIENANGTLPVTGLDFKVKRISSGAVLLEWNTIHENRNKGFFIERKKENENGFVQLDFVKSGSSTGNSFLPLKYNYTDQNTFSGKTYYRLKQVDLDGESSYSFIKVVNGGEGKITSLKVWPNPSSGPVTTLLEGIEKDQLFVFDTYGRLIMQFIIQEQVPLQIKGLRPGTYYLKLKMNKELYQKIIIQ